MTHIPSVEIDWENGDKTLIRWTFRGNWTGEDYFLSLPKLWNMVDSTTYPVHLLVDMTQAGTHPSNLLILIQAAIRKDRCNVHHIVVVSHNNFWEMLYNLFSRTYSAATLFQVEFVSSLDEAYQRLPQP